MKKLSVLVIEDETVLQEVYKIVIVSQGHAVHTANNGREGISQLNSISPDVVLLDIFMPVMDGKEFLRNVDTSQFPDTKFIVYSNLVDEAIEKEMLELGADKVILKSTMTPKDLRDLISQYAN